MRFWILCIALLLSVPAMAHDYTNINPADFNLAPGERLVEVDGIPVGPPQQAADDGQRFPILGAPVRAVANVAAAIRDSHPTNIVGNLVRSGLPFSYTPGSTALEKANYERRRNGVGNLTPDPGLMALALQKASIAASRGHKNHIGGSLGGARAEGVGHTNGRFLSCCLDMPATYGGAAMVQGRDGWYCCLLVR